MGGYIRNFLNKAKPWAIPALIIVLIAMNVILLNKHNSVAYALSEQRVATVKVKDRLQSSSKRLTELSEQKASITSSLKKERLKSQKLDKENKRLKANLQAKKQREAKAATVAEQERNETPAPAKVTGDKHSWLAASGIPESQWQYVDYIVSRESGWDPCAYNPGQSDCNANPSSACGLAQSLPCGKQSGYGHWTDPVANLKWQYEYVKGRYGGYVGAYNFWLANHYY